MAIRRSEFSLRQMIYYLYRDTLLPEIYEELGEQTTIKLISIFGGVKITVPSYTKIKELKRNIDIYETLCHAQGKETVRILAYKYGVSEVWIRSVFKKMRREYSRIIEFMEMIDNPKKVTISTKRNLIDGKDDRKRTP